MIELPVTLALIAMPAFVPACNVTAPVAVIGLEAVMLPPLLSVAWRMTVPALRAPFTRKLPVSTIWNVPPALEAPEMLAVSPFEI